MKYGFDKVIDRHNTCSVKYDGLREHFSREDLLPLWVADMDFATPEFIIDAIRKRLDHPVLGYGLKPDGYWPSVIRWIKRRHGWDVKEEWLRYIPGVVKGIGMAVNAFTAPGDSIIIQTPVYHPFRIIPEENGRKIVRNPLIMHDDGSYGMDFAGLEKICREGARMLILSNPHNPAGIIWGKETLEKVADICHRNNVLVISDEIHSDMALFGNRHIPFVQSCARAKEISITFGAPTKTFNMAGVVSSYAIVPDERIRSRFFSYLEANEFDSPDLFAPVATMAAFDQGEEWREEMIRYVEQNIILIEDFIRENIPAIKVLRPQASYLVWIDFRGLGLSHDMLVSLVEDKARLALNDGAMFGKEGEGFMRLNAGCPRSLLERALSQLKEAVSTL